MSSFIFSPQYIYWDNVKDHESIKEKLLPIIYKIRKNELSDNHNPFELCTLVSSLYNKDNEKTYTINNFLQEPYVVDKVVWNTLDKCLKHLREKCMIEVPVPQSSIISEAWFNMYNKGDHQEMHDHINVPVKHNNRMYYTTYSIIYILKDESEQSSVVFRECLNKDLMGYKQVEVFDTSKVPDIKEGTVLIFPSSLHHVVKPVLKSGRITIAYNIRSTWDKEV